MATLTITYLHKRGPDTNTSIPESTRKQEKDICGVDLAHSSFDGSGIPTQRANNALGLIHITNFPPSAISLIQTMSDAQIGTSRSKYYAVDFSSLTAQQVSDLEGARQTAIDFLAADALNFIRAKIVNDADDITKDTLSPPIDFGAMM